jgi:eukaryotic-like serine/threonine-protein kinase
MTDESANFEPGIYGLPVERPTPIPSGRDPVEVLASEFLESLRGATRPDIEAYVTKYPELAEQIRELFPVLAALEDWKAYRERTSFEHRSIETLTNELFGEFCIVREVGRGGMGIVFEAREQSTARRVAIKVIPFLESKRLRDSFEREARTAARLRHNHIVPVYAYGRHDGLSYYVMRLIEGVGLDWMIRQLAVEGSVLPKQISMQFATLGDANRPPSDVRPTVPSTTEFTTLRESSAFASGLRCDSWHEFARIGAQAAHALNYAHTRGTLHRDIKPANLLIDPEGRIWMTDFGLAHTVDALAEHQSSRTAGTLRYLAPEQFAGRVDFRTDIYSLGVTLFELLTRSPAFEARDRQSLIAAIRSSSVPRPRSLNPDIPRDLDAIICKAMAKEPASRYTSAVELWADLMRFMKGQRPSARDRLRWLKR